MSHLRQLVCLNLSENLIQKIENLSANLNLETLLLSKNRIGGNGISDWEALKDLAVVSLDISNNHIDCQDPEDFLSVLGSMPKLKVLYMQNNPICAKIRNYRRRLIAHLPLLTYLGRQLEAECVLVFWIRFETMER